MLHQMDSHVEPLGRPAKAGDLGERTGTPAVPSAAGLYTPRNALSAPVWSSASFPQFNQISSFGWKTGRRMAEEGVEV